jgi:FMN phosphatase YigB (HAD superfamily)
VTIKAAFFDVGDTLVEHWAARDVTTKIARAQICAELGEHPWVDDLLAAEIEPIPPASLAQRIGQSVRGARFEPESSRQETQAWYRTWFEAHGIGVDGIDLDRLRSLMCVPLAEISTPVPGAFDALKWCVGRGLRVVLVTNTLARGDAEVLQDWKRFGLADAVHSVVSSHSAGWRKPHPAIFERALERAEAAPDEAFHVGDNLIADVYGAQQLGIKAVWRRAPRLEPPSDERGRPPDRFDASRAECQHPSEQLTLLDDEVVCVACERPAGVAVRPEATIHDLTELPAIVGRWLEAGERVA